MPLCAPSSSWRLSQQPRAAASSSLSPTHVASVWEYSSSWYSHELECLKRVVSRLRTKSLCAREALGCARILQQRPLVTRCDSPEPEKRLVEVETRRLLKDLKR